MIESGGIFLGANSVLSVHETDLSMNGGLLIADDTSTLFFSTDTSERVIDGHGIIRADSLILSGVSINSVPIETRYLILENGALNLDFTQVKVDSFVLNETEINQIRGVSLQTTFNAIANEESEPANFGLSLIFSDSEQNLELTRTNNFVKFGEQYSLLKQYGFDRLVNTIDKITFNYFNADVGELHNESLFRVFTSIDGFDWTEQSNMAIDTNSNSVEAEIDGTVKYFTLIEGEPDYDLFIPNGFSPNQDGFNDQFEILGLNKFPNNRLVVINTSGGVVFEAQPYENNWEGINVSGEGNLPTGTYYYQFFTDVNDPKSVMQGFVELRGGRR